MTYKLYLSKVLNYNLFCSDEFYLTKWRDLPDPVEGRQTDKVSIAKNMFSALFKKNVYVIFCKKNDCKKMKETYSKLNNGIVMDKHNRMFICNFYYFSQFS